VTKCMFSPGNITEKLRVASLPCSGEVLVDLYAGNGDGGGVWRGGRAEGSDAGVDGIQGDVKRHFQSRLGKAPRLRAPAPSVSPQLTWHCRPSCVPVALGRWGRPCAQALWSTAVYLVLVMGVI